MHSRLIVRVVSSIAVSACACGSLAATPGSAALLVASQTGSVGGSDVLAVDAQGNPQGTYLPGTAGALHTPMTIAVGPDGNLHIADAANAEIWRFNPVSGNLSTFVVIRGQVSPDADGLAHWVGELRQAMTDERLEAAFAAAPEFYQYAGGTDAGWAQAMYLDLLGRAADAAGLSHWTGQLAHGADRASVALGFAASGERETQRVSDDYFADLGRVPDAAGQAYWVNAFENGMRNEDVIAGFLTSHEYHQAHSTGA